MVKAKRVYEPPDKSDGFRILVDRLWPRGLTKEKVREGTVTLVYGAKDIEHNNAQALKEYLSGGRS